MEQNTLSCRRGDKRVLTQWKRGGLQLMSTSPDRAVLVSEVGEYSQKNGVGGVRPAS